MSNGQARLMTHMVSHFPSRAASVAVASGLARGGASYIELQFPFSDPSADGNLIQTACTKALDQGFTVADGFALASEIVKGTGLPLFIMSYGNLVVRRGVDWFVRRAKEAGATGLIVPDLMPGSDEGLYAEGARSGVEIVPVVAPSISGSRLAMVAEVKPAYLYAALRVGITGSYTEIGDENRSFLERLEPLGAKLLAGFGIRSHEQVSALAGRVHALVVGSAIVQAVLDALSRGEESHLSECIEAKTREILTGACGT